MVRSYKSFAYKKRHMRLYQNRLIVKPNNSLEMGKKDQKESNSSGDCNLYHQKRR